MLKMLELTIGWLDRRSVQVRRRRARNCEAYHAEAADILNGMLCHIVGLLKQWSLSIVPSNSHDTAKDSCSWYRGSQLPVSRKVSSSFRYFEKMPVIESREPQLWGMRRSWLCIAAWSLLRGNEGHAFGGSRTGHKLSVMASQAFMRSDGAAKFACSRRRGQAESCMCMTLRSLP